MFNSEDPIKSVTLVFAVAFGLIVVSLFLMIVAPIASTTGINGAKQRLEAAGYTVFAAGEGFIRRVYDEGSELTAREILDFNGSGVTCTDDGSAQTNCVIPLAGTSSTLYVCASDAGATDRCDYVADGTADEVQIQAAIDALPAVGGTVSLSEGTFHVADTVDLTSDMSLIGMGIDATTIRLVDSSDVATIQGDTLDHVTLEDFNVDGNTDNQSSAVHAITWSGVSNGVINSVKAEEAGGNGIRIGSSSTLVSLSNCITVNNDQRGIHVVGSTNVTVSGCLSQGNTLDGIDIDGASSNVTISNNVTRNNTRNGIFVEENVTDVTVIGNICSTNTVHGINVNQQDASETVERVTIVGNTCRENDGHGIRVRANAASTTVRNVVITGNVTMNNGQGASNTRGITVGANASGATENILIADNRSGDSQSTKTQTYGIEIQANPTSVLVVNNDVEGNDTGGILNSAGAGAIIRDNLGFDTEAAGTATVADSTTSISVTHGLDVTPTAADCSVTPTNDLGNAAKFWTDTFGATTFDINVDSDPGAGTATFAWTCTEY